MGLTPPWSGACDDYGDDDKTINYGNERKKTGRVVCARATDQASLAWHNSSYAFTAASRARHKPPARIGIKISKSEPASDW